MIYVDKKMAYIIHFSRRRKKTHFYNDLPAYKISNPILVTDA